VAERFDWESIGERFARIVLRAARNPGLAEAAA
jgi:hypothetical protein